MNLQSVKFTVSETWKAAPLSFFAYVCARSALSLAIIVNAFTIKEIIDAATGKETFFHLSVYGIIWLRFGYELFRKGMEFLASYSWSILASRQLIFLNRSFVDKIATLDLSLFESSQTIGLITRAFNRLQNQQNFISVIVGFWVSVLEIALSTSIFIFASPLIACFIFAANLIPIIVRGKMSHGIFFIFRSDDETRRKFGYTSQILFSRVILPQIKVFQAFGFFKQRLTDIYHVFTQNQLKKELQSSLFGTLADVVPIFAVFFFIFSIAGSATTGSLSVGMFAFFLINVFSFFNAMRGFVGATERMDVEGNFVSDVVDFFKLKSNIFYPVIMQSAYSVLKKKLQNPTIEIQNISFQYPNTQECALKNISLTIPFGQNIAIIGENGAGKTTLIKLILRMYDPQEGRILVNGIDIREFPEDILFGLYSTLFQGFGRMYLTIRENLEIAARKKLTEEEMIKILKFSNAWEFIKKTKNGVEQQLGPEYADGIELSGGEWQKIGIAQAYAKKTPILILDEPTSNMDAKSEIEVFDRIHKEMKGNTLIFISHRFSTIKDAERIVVLDSGRVTEDGTHSELIQKNGTYAKLYTLQAERYLREENE